MTLATTFRLYRQLEWVLLGIGKAHLCSHQTQVHAQPTCINGFPCLPGAPLDSTLKVGSPCYEGFVENFEVRPEKSVDFHGDRGSVSPSPGF